MQVNAGQVMDAVLDWQERLTRKTRSWPAPAQGIRVLIGLMLIALLMRLFAPGGLFWVECAPQAIYIGLTALCDRLLQYEQRCREQRLAWTGDWVAQIGSDVPGRLAAVESCLRTALRRLGRLRLLCYAACRGLAGGLVWMARFMRAAPVSEFIAIPLLLLFLPPAVWPARRLRDRRKEQACAAHLQEALPPQARLPAGSQDSAGLQD